MSDTLVLKSCVAFEVKDAEKGDVEAIIATLGVVDKDEDIIVPGAIPDGAKVSMSAYGHDAVYGTAPVGKGAIHVEGNKAIFKGRMFLTTTRGRDTFELLKAMGADQEWSFGFRIMGAEVPDDAARKQGARRILTKLDCFEVSPVIIGAGVGTQTLGVKGAEVVAPDPAIEAARLAAEEAAAATTRELEAKARTDADARAAMERRFRRGLPTGVR
jgi:hypothetical protein